MKTSFHRLITADGLELHGLMYEPEFATKTVLIHVHGMGGNFYENKFLDHIAAELVKSGIAFVTFNNRGCEFIKDTYGVLGNGELEFRRIGTSYEKFEESQIDIDSYINFVEKRGFLDIHLSGHSLGCSKVAYYMGERGDSRIKSLLLLSPSDMLGLVRDNMEKFASDVSEAQKLKDENKGGALLSQWLWGDYPISANTYLDLFGDGAKDGIFSFYNRDDNLVYLAKLTIPVYAVMGRKDDALTTSIEETLSRLERALVNSPLAKTEILGEATHGYRGHESELAQAVSTWLISVKA